MTSTENILQTLQRFIQDVLAPDVRELKVKVQAIDDKMDLQFKALMAAISEVKLHGEVAALRSTINLAERVAILETRLEEKQ